MPEIIPPSSAMNGYGCSLILKTYFYPTFKLIRSILIFYPGCCTEHSFEDWNASPRAFIASMSSVSEICWKKCSLISDSCIALRSSSSFYAFIGSTCFFGGALSSFSFFFMISKFFSLLNSRSKIVYITSFSLLELS